MCLTVIQVGFEDVREGHGTCLPTSTDEDFVWWRFNLARKFGGQWYSTPRRGQCKPKRIEVKEGQQLVRDGQSSPCSWQIQETVSTIKSSCLRARIIKVGLLLCLFHDQVSTLKLFFSRGYQSRTVVALVPVIH